MKREQPLKEGKRSARKPAGARETFSEIVSENRRQGERRVKPR
jgi:hypothetical protein